MKKFKANWVINAKPMNRLEYNQFRGWKLPENENGADEGYLVENPSARESNAKEYKGYVSWLPTDVFHKLYEEC